MQICFFKIGLFGKVILLKYLSFASFANGWTVQTTKGQV